MPALDAFRRDCAASGRRAAIRRPASQTSDQAWACDWRTIMYPPIGFQSPPW